MLGDRIDRNGVDPRIMALELADEGYVSHEELALMCLKYMSHDDVRGMLKVNELDVVCESQYGVEL